MERYLNTKKWALNIIRILTIAVTIFICVGCANQSQNQNLNENSLSGLGMELSTSKAVDGSKAATNTQTEITSTKKLLENLTICIDAGHGQTTRNIKKKEPIAPGSKIMKAATSSGTSGVSTKISEESLNLTVSKKLKKALIDKGAEIVMVRETSKCDLTNVERTKLWNSSGADLTIRIHGNGIDNSKVSGVLMMIPGDKYIKDKDMLKKSEQAGQYILDGVLKYTKAKSRGIVKSTDLTGFNWSTVPVILLEMGFMTNQQEDKLLNTDAYQDKIVAGIVEGTEKYYNSLLEESK
jgi:N-acetylmuramoyl-L-alanine amidase